MKTLKRTLALLLSLILTLSLGSAVWADDAPADAKKNDTQTVSGLKVGAGTAEIDFSVWPEDVEFPEARKGFGPNSIHDNPHARVLLLESNERVALIALELVQISGCLDDLKAAASEALDVDEDHIWIHCTHSVVTPHSDGSELYTKIVADAIREASAQALESFQDAVMGVAEGTCAINSNRNITEPEGAHQVEGSRDTTFYSAPNVADVQDAFEIVGESNEKMTLIGFASKETGEPITCLISYGVKPNTIDAAGFDTAGSMISSDTPGYACMAMEEELDVPVMFFMSAAGDQTTDESAKIYGFDENGEWAYLDFGFDAGYEMVERLGSQMSSDALSIFSKMQFDQDAPEIALNNGAFDAEGTNREGERVNTSISVDTMTIGSVALVGVQPEIDAVTDMQLQAASPYDHTLLISFMNGDGKYLPHAEAYDYNNGKGTYEVSKSNYDKGSAEKMIKTAVELLGGTYEIPEEKGTLQVGAGAAVIDLDQKWNDGFPESNKGFNGTFDETNLPYARVLLLDNGQESAAIVSMEMVQLTSCVDELRSVAAKALGINESNVWVHTTHVITTPHQPNGEADSALYVKVMSDAIKEAAAQALASKQDAVMGVGTTTCTVNANRNIVEPAGVTTPAGQRDTTFYSAPNVMETVGEVNETMTILRFETPEGEPIAFFMSYGVKPNTIDAAGLGTTLDRIVQADTPGLACKMVEEKYGVPCMFCMPAAGDQTTDESAKIYGFDENGQWQYLDLGVQEGLAMVKRLGTEMGNAALSITDTIKCTEKSPAIEFRSAVFGAEGTNREGQLEVSDVSVDTLTVGSVAFVGFKPELDAKTEMEIQEQSPYDTTLLISFLNGDGKYMPHAEAYDFGNGKGTYEVYKSSFVKGTAEKLAQTALELLGGTWQENADDFMKSIKVTGSVQVDGAKPDAVIVEYSEPLLAESVSIEDFEVRDYANIANPACELGGNAGAVTKVYVNDKPEISAEGGTAQGQYVIFEINKDYQLEKVPNYRQAMAAGVLQTGEVKAASGKVIPGGHIGIDNYEVSVSNSAGRDGTISTNYTFTVEDGTFEIKGLEGFSIFDGAQAFHAENCYSETFDDVKAVDLPYALYVPEGYHKGGNYALTIYIPDSGANGEDVMLGLTTTKAATNLAGDEVQQMVKAQGLDGMFVLVPQFSSENGNTAWKVTSDNFTLSYGLPATWQLLDQINDKYDINSDRIYGIGQSQGGMMIEAMAAQRDNYFAALWCIGCEWGNNYNKDDTAYDGKAYGTSHDSTIQTENYENWFYLFSDDNVLITTCAGDAFATACFKELRQVYKDLTGTEIPQVGSNALTDSLEDQNAAYRKVTSGSGNFGMYWVLLAGGDHNKTWTWAHKTMAAYEWLVSQTRQTEESRSKLEDLNRPWIPETDPAKIAAGKTEDRVILTDQAGNKYYYAVPAKGAGTIGYNSTLYGRGASTILRVPGWIPVTLSKTSAESAAGSSFKIDASLDLAGAAITWSSSNEAVAVVDSTGTVTARTRGSAVITASAADGRATGKCNVNVLFNDVTSKASQYYYDAVYWAADNGITKGYGNVYFGPERDCERREMMIFLWRIAGCPEVKDVNPAASFSDMQPYGPQTDTFKAVAWGISEGIIRGYSDGTFRPTASVTRKDALVMLYRVLGKPESEGSISFKDVTGLSADSDTYKAIVWASVNGITHGYSDNTFRPDDSCLREHIVTFLYRNSQLQPAGGQSQGGQGQGGQGGQGQGGR